MVHITYPILCMSYSYTYITFIVIYYIPFVMFYFLVLLSCTVFMYYFQLLCSCIALCTVFMYSFHILVSCFTFHITFSFILAFQIILHSYTFSYSMSDRIISCYRTCHHIAGLCFSYHIISFHMSYSNHLFYVSCLHKP